jgi:DNA-binding MltR family transcriptional regulator
LQLITLARLRKSTMAKTPGSIEALSEDMKELLFVMNEESDLAAVLVGTSYLDQCLGTLIKRKLGTTPLTLKLLGPEKGSLGELQSRAEIVHSLGLIARPIHDDLIKIAEIRNHFAGGDLMASFADQKVNELCEGLVLIRLFDQTWFEANGKATDKSARSRFIATVAFICQRLLIDAFGPRIEKNNDLPQP